MKRIANYLITGGRHREWRMFRRVTINGRDHAFGYMVMVPAWELVGPARLAGADRLRAARRELALIIARAVADS